MRAWIVGVSALMLAGGALAQPASLPKSAPLPKDLDVLFWTQDQRDAAFRATETLTKVNTIAAGGAVHPLGQGAPLKISMDMDAYMAHQRNAGLIILQDGKIRFEKYAMGYGPEGRWTSFSVAKSFTSSLVGAAACGSAVVGSVIPTSLLAGPALVKVAFLNDRQVTWGFGRGEYVFHAWPRAGERA